METKKELILGEKPPRLDAIVLKKEPARPLKDVIGCFFRETNVFEFKGFGDGININDIYKIEGYALFYMTIDKKVNEIPLESVTITVLQYRFPRDVLKILESMTCKISQRCEGIFEISGGPIIFPFQIVDAATLGSDWDILKVLVPGATEDQISKIQKEYERASDHLQKQHLADVLRTSFESNKGLFRKMKEAGEMSEAVEFVFKEEIEEAFEKKQEKTIENMLKDDVKVSNIAKWTGMPIEKIVEIATKIGLNTLAL